MNFELLKKKKKIILIILFLILVRIPIALFPDFLFIETILIEELKQGKLIYCNFEDFAYGSFYKEHVYPLGTYLYFIIKNYTIKNFILIVLEILNIFLIVKIITHFYEGDSSVMVLTFVAFFPMSILNNGFGTDPMQLVLATMLLGILLFLRNHYYLSAVFIAFGTLLVYLPSIILVPISFYFLKKNKFSKLVKFFLTFMIIIILSILPFLIICPTKFIDSIVFSLNQPHSANFLRNENFILSNILYIELIHIGAISFVFLNLIQILVLLLSLFYVYKTFDYNDGRDIIFVTIFLITIITIITFYIHLRFFYYIFLFSLIIFVYNSEKSLTELKISEIILFGIVFLIISLIGLVMALGLNIQTSNDLYWIVGLSIFSAHTFCFLILGLGIEHTNSRRLFIYSTIIGVNFIIFILLAELINFSIVIYNLINILILISEILVLFLFLKSLKRVHKKFKFLIPYSKSDEN